MASRTASVRAVNLIRGDDAVIGSENANFKTKVYALSIDSNTITVIGGTDTLDCAVDTAITAATRNGKTVTLRSAMVGEPTYDDVNATAYSATLSISGNTVSLTPKTSDWTTNATIATGAGAGRPYIVYVTVNEA